MTEHVLPRKTRRMSIIFVIIEGAFRNTKIRRDDIVWGASFTNQFKAFGVHKPN